MGRIATIIFGCIIIFTGCTPNYNDNSKLTSEINGKKFRLEVANSDSKKSTGLGRIKSLASDSGMLFLFDDKNYLQFWMKDTLIPLEIIFIDGCKIVDVQSMPVEKDPQNPQTIYRSKEPADKAIEINENSFSKETIGQEIDQLCKI